MSQESEIFYDPAQFLLDREGGERTVLVILNMPIPETHACEVMSGDNGRESRPQPQTIFEKLWAFSKYRVCADGGANRLYQHFKHDKKRREQFLPDFIAGDLDSAWPRVLKYYAARGVDVIGDSDQYSTDLMKCIKLAQERWFSDEPSVASSVPFKVITLGALGGRVDQSFHSLHHLYISQEGSHHPAAAQQNGELDMRYEKNRATVAHQLTLVSVTATHANVTLLVPGGVTVRIATPTRVLGPAVGIIPLSGPTRLTTSGLEYDVHDWATAFGGLVSTSNYLREEEVRVDSEPLPVVFTVEIRMWHKDEEDEENSDVE